MTYFVKIVLGESLTTLNNLIEPQTINSQNCVILMNINIYPNILQLTLCTEWKSNYNQSFENNKN